MEITKQKSVNFGAVLAMVLIVASLVCTFMGLITLHEDVVAEIVTVVEEGRAELPELIDMGIVSPSDGEILENIVDAMDSTLTDGSISVLDVIVLNNGFAQVLDAEGLMEELEDDDMGSSVVDMVQGLFLGLTIGLIVCLVILAGFGIMAFVNNLNGGKWWTMIYPLVWTLMMFVLFFLVLVVNQAVGGYNSIVGFPENALCSVSVFAYIALATAYGGFIIRFATMPKTPKAPPAYNPYSQSATPEMQQEFQQDFAPSNPEVRFCVACGSKIQHSGKFCTSCGAKQP